LSDEAGNKPGKADEGADREQKGPPASYAASPPKAPGPAEEAGEEAGEQPGQASDEDASEDMPTLPPASRGSVIGLRWATVPLQRRGGQVGPDQIGPDPIGPQRFEPGPPTVVMPTVVMPTVVMPTVVMPVVLSEHELRPEGRDPTAEQDAVEGPTVGGATWVGGPAWVGAQDAFGGPNIAGGPEELDGEPRRPRRRRRRAVLMLAALALAAAVAVGVLALGGGSRHTRAVRTPTPQATFDGFLVESAQAHQLLAAAVSDACKPAPPATTTRQDLIGQVSRAVEMRRSVLNGIASHRRQLLAMNGGPSLVSDLDDATRASLSADQGYEAWLEDLQATGCYGAPTNDIHYHAATAASLAASVAKQRVVLIWAGVASRYGLPSWTAGQL
jgi:hypothetical protein